MPRIPRPASAIAPGTPFFFVLLLFLAVLLLPAAAGAQGVTPEVAGCMACHAGVTRPHFDPETGEVRDIAIDMRRFGRADHGRVTCLDCHVEGFHSFPHFQKKSLACMECHPRPPPDAQEDAPYEFERIEREFTESVHFTEHPEQFTCMTCHEPHYFQATRRFASPRLILENDNGPCIACHEPDATGPLADPVAVSLLDSHLYLRHPELHLRATRCIECHSSVDHPVTHDLRGEDAERGCVTCHTRQSVLMTRLYRYHAEDMEHPWGFTNPTLLEDSYVMGANRLMALDWLTYGLTGGALLGVAVHAGLRVARRYRRRTAAGNARGDGR